MTDDEIYDVIHSVITTVTGISGSKVIPANDNGKAPAGSYASILVASSTRQRGQANVYLSNTDLISSPIGMVRDVDFDIRPQVAIDVSINFYRDDSLQNARKLFQANKRPDVQAMLFQANLGWVNENPINNLTALQSKQFEQRAEITITLWFEQIETVTTNAIYNVPVVVENESGDTLEQIDVQAPTGV